MARAAIDIGPKPLRDGDERYVRAGIDPGKTVRIQLGERTVFINLQGGVRVPESPMDFKDSSGASQAGVSHSDRTDKVFDKGYEININVWKKHWGSKKELTTDVKLFLQKNRTTLQAATSGGFYPKTPLVWRRLADPERIKMTNEVFVPTIKAVQSFELSSD